jgi:integrase
LPKQFRRDPLQNKTILPPKWGSVRKILLPPVLVEVLAAHRRRQVEERLAAGPKWIDNDLVFCSKSGRPLNPSNVIRRDFRRICRNAGIQFSDSTHHGLRFHDLRGSAISILLAQGQDIPTIMEIMGHRSVAMFLKYNKVLKRQKAASAGALEKLYGRTP